MRRKIFVRLVARLAKALDARGSKADDAPIDPALLPLDLAAPPTANH